MNAEQSALTPLVPQIVGRERLSVTRGMDLGHKGASASKIDVDKPQLFYCKTLGRNGLFEENGAHMAMRQSVCICVSS